MTLLSPVGLQIERELQVMLDRQHVKLCTSHRVQDEVVAEDQLPQICVAAQASGEIHQLDLSLERPR